MSRINGNHQPKEPQAVNGRVSIASKRALTREYLGTMPTMHNRPRDLPPLNADLIRAMLLDSAVRLGLAMRAAPLMASEIAFKDGDKWTPGVRAERPEVGEFIRRQYARIWLNGLESILTGQIWGWASGEVMLRTTRIGTVEVDYLLPRSAMDTRALISDGEVAGTRVLKVKHVGHVDLKFPKGYFHAHRPEPGSHYGQSILLGCYSPWADKCFQGGALDVRRLFMHKDAYGGCDISYPDSTTIINGEEIPNRDIALQIVEQIQAGGVTTRPASYDVNGKEQWTIARATVPSHPGHILEYPKDLDTEIFHGMEIPDDVIESENGGAWAGKQVPMAAFYSSLDVWLISIIRDIEKQIIRPLLALNFRKPGAYEVTHKPLAVQASEQQQQAQQPPGGQQPNFEGGQMPGIKMGLDAEEAIGEGVLSAEEMVQAARRVMADRATGDTVLRMEADERWITIGGRNKENAEHSGGFPVKIDGDGNIVAGGPKGLRGKHVGKVHDYFRRVRNTPKAKEARYQRTVQKRAESWGITPEEYQSVIDEVLTDKRQKFAAREKAKAYARERLGVTAGDINRLENQGFDHASGKVKGLDTLGREMAAEFADLGWGAGYKAGENYSDDVDYEAEVWNLVKEGKQKQPDKDSPEFLEDVDEYLNYVFSQSGSSKSKGDDTDWSKIEFSIGDSQSTRMNVTDDEGHVHGSDGKFTNKPDGAGKPRKKSPSKPSVHPAAAQPEPVDMDAFHRDYDEAHGDAKPHEDLLIKDLREKLPQYTPGQFNYGVRKLREQGYLTAESAHGGDVKGDELIDRKNHGIKEGDAPHQELVYLARRKRRDAATKMAAAHAPKGGISIAGKKFTGGEFIPGEVMDKATPDEKAAVAGGKSVDHQSSTVDLRSISPSNHKDQWERKKHADEATFWVGGESTYDEATNTKTTTVAPLPMSAELRKLNADYMSELDDDDKEKQLLLNISEETGSDVREYVFRNLRTEFGESEDAFGVTGTGHAKETIRKSSELLLASMAKHQYPVYYMTAEEESRARVYRRMLSKVADASHGHYVAMKISSPHYAGAFIVVKSSLQDEISDTIRSHGFEVSIMSTSDKSNRHYMSMDDGETS